MDFANNYELEELSAAEMEEVDGGLLPLIAAAGAAFQVGFRLGQTIVAYIER
jgi:lactobin A/cerein 7B family class IIb bacteriocin